MTIQEAQLVSYPNHMILLEAWEFNNGRKLTTSVLFPASLDMLVRTHANIERQSGPPGSMAHFFPYLKNSCSLRVELNGFHCYTVLRNLAKALQNAEDNILTRIG